MRYTLAIPTYNSADVLENAILSVLNQKGNVLHEVLIVDNCSTDDTAEIIAKYEKDFKITIIRNKETVSQFENHNICLRKALGDYVLFCHSDDVLYEDALVKLDRVLSIYHYPGKIVCWGRSFFRDFYGNFSQVGELNKIVSGISAQQLFQNGGLTPSGTCYSRESFIKSGGFLPMRSNITPSDMSSMIKYSLDGAEFLMLDRLLFKRELASTAHEVTQEDSFESVEHAIEELVKVLPPKTITTLFDNINTFTAINLWYMLILSKHSPEKSFKNKFKLKLKLKFIFRNPHSLSDKFTRKLLFKKMSS